MAPKSAKKQVRGRKRPIDEIENEHKEEEDSMMEEQKGEEIEQQLKKKQKSGEPLFKCPICFDEFEQSSNQVRFLPCGNSLCRTCILDRIQRNPLKNTLTCPLCSLPHLLDHPDVEVDATVLIDRVPAVNQFFKRNDWLGSNEPVQPSTTTATPAAAAAATSSSSTIDPPAPTCRVSGCSKLATHLCTVCVHMFQCSEHEVSEHVDRPTHVRVSLEERRIQREKEEAEIQLKRKEKAAKLVDKIESTTLAKLKAIESEWSNDSPWVVQRELNEKANRDHLAEDKKLIADLFELVTRLKEEAEHREKWLTSNSVLLKHDRSDLLAKIEAKKAKVDQFKNLSYETILATSDLQVNELMDLTLLNQAVQSLSERRSQAQLSKPVSDSTVDYIRNLKLPTLLPALDRLPAKASLESFLLQSNKSLVNAQLIYKASLNGWTSGDFIRCCAGKSETILFVQTAEKKYVFGAYISPAWPPVGKKGVVPDGSMKSFIFSLTNPSGHPIRLSLTKPDSAVDFSGTSIGFGQQNYANGKQIHWFNMMLFYYYRPGNDPCGIALNPQNDARFVYRLDEESKKSAPMLGFRLDGETFCGHHFCGASEIEVYQL